MSEARVRHLMFHGGIVLLLGLIAGIPYAEAIMSNWEPDALRAWRNAHLGLTSGGLLLLVVAGVSRYLVIGERGTKLLVGSFVASVWAAVVGLGFGAIVGQRGLAPTGPALNLVVFAGNAVLAVCAFVGVILLIVGSRPGGRSDATG